MSSSKVSLLQIPEIPMKHILEYLEFPSILILRKVCHDLRNFIDDTKPSSRFTVIDVKVHGGFIACDLFFPRSIDIRYNKNEGGCLVKNTSSYEKIERKIDEDFATVFCKEFNIVLKHQKTVLEVFKITFDQFDSELNERILENVKKSLKSMNKPLQVKSLVMGVNSPNEILSILPYIDSKPVKWIQIIECLGKGNVVLNYDEIGQLKQWKQADGLWIERFELPKLSQSFKHFSKITFRVYHFEDLILIKELFVRSSALNEMRIDYNYNCEDDIKQGLIEAFGQPSLDTDQNEDWFFRIPDTNQFLRIIRKRLDIRFNRIKQSDVPQNGIILN